MKAQIATAGRSYAIVPKIWPGETIAILGGGPSLTEDDIKYVRGKAHVVAIKEAYRLAPWADILYGCETRWWQGEKGVPSFTGVKYAMESVHDDDMKWYATWPDIRVLRNTGMEGLELDPTGLRTGQNSGFQAINLSVHLGAARIVLLGFDMWRDPNGRQNWHTDRPEFVRSHHIHTPYPLLMTLFATIVEPLKAAQVEVVNASRFTVLSAFPRVALEEALR